MPRDNTILRPRPLTSLLEVLLSRFRFTLAVQFENIKIPSRSHFLNPFKSFPFPHNFLSNFSGSIGLSTYDSAGFPISEVFIVRKFDFQHSSLLIHAPCPHGFHIVLISLRASPGFSTHQDNTECLRT